MRRLPARLPRRCCLSEIPLHVRARKKKALHAQRRSEWSCLRCRAGSREDLGPKGSWVCGAKADWKKVLVDTTLSVVRRPTRSILKQTNCSDATIPTEIEPV